MGKGAYGKVYLISIEGMGTFVDKKSEYDNIKDALKEINNAYREFKIGKKIFHAGIVDHKYFIHTYSNKKFQSHLILEYLEGGDLS